MGRWVAVLFLPLLAASPAPLVETIHASQATAAVELPVCTSHTGGQILAVLPPGTPLTLITGPYNGWWYGRQSGGTVEGWFEAARIARTAKSIPSGTRWVDITIDDLNQKYVARLLVDSVVVDQMDIGAGTEETPTPEGTFRILYRNEELFELQAAPGVFLKCWQTIRWDGPGTLAWGIHSWVLGADGYPTTMNQFGRVSHGCIRLPRPADVFSFLTLHSTAYIHFSPWTGAVSTRLMAVKTVSGTNFNVRSGPGPAYGILGQVQGGQKYVCDRQYMGWYRITYAAGYAWIWGQLAGRVSSPIVRVNTQQLNVRATASTSGTIVGPAYYGRRYARTGATSGIWIQVWYKGKKAWVHGSYVVKSTLP